MGIHKGGKQSRIDFFTQASKFTVTYVCSKLHINNKISEDFSHIRVQFAHHCIRFVIDFEIVFLIVNWN